MGKIAIILLPLVISGCVFIKPNDMSFVKAKLINVKEKTGTEIDNGRYIQAAHYIPRLEVTISSNTNLLKLYSENNLWPQVKANFCDKPEEEVLMARRVHYKGILLEDLVDAKKLKPKVSSITPSDNGLYEYQVHLALYSRYFGGNNPYQEYDLVTNPRDVCIKIRGATMFHVKASNKIILTKAKIQDALAKLSVSKS